MGKIAKSGKSFKGCVEYCMLKKDAVVLNADGVRTGEVAHTIADFNMQRKMRPSLGQAVGHIALNWSPEDSPKLTNELMVSIAIEYLKKMKISDTQVLMVRHHDTNHPHLHLVYNRVDNEGKTISDANQRWNNVKASKTLTQKYGFHIAVGKDRVNRHRLKGADKAKYQIHDQIKAILPKVKNMDELQKQLAMQGIEMLYKYKSGTQEIQGISFSKGEYQFKGSEIDRSLSYGKISKILADQMLQQRQKERIMQPKSLADELREIIEQSEVKSGRNTHYLKPQAQPKYLKQNSQGDHLVSLTPQIDLSDDVDDEAVYGHNRRRQEKTHTIRR